MKYCDAILGQNVEKYSVYNSVKSNVRIL